MMRSPETIPAANPVGKPWEKTITLWMAEEPADEGRTKYSLENTGSPESTLQARDAMDFLPKGSTARMEQAYKRQGMPADRIKAAMLENARRMKASKIMALEKRLENGK